MKFGREAESLNITKTHKTANGSAAMRQVALRRWRSVGVLAVTLLFMLVFCDQAYAADVGDDAGVEKETMFSLIQKGGKIMYPLALGSIIALALGFERFIALRKERILPDEFLDGLTQAWNSDPTGKAAIKYCEESDGTAAHIFKAGIRRAKMGPDVVERTIEDVGSREADKMKRSLRPISVIATVSPLLGLLGTVYGMIDAFQKTSSSGGTAKTAMLATGIYEALVTTAAGLTIAIPVLLLYQFLLGRVDNMIDEIDEAGTEFIHTYTESHPGLKAEPAAAPAQPVARQPKKKARPKASAAKTPTKASPAKAPPAKTPAAKAPPTKASRPQPPPPPEPPPIATEAGT